MEFVIVTCDNEQRAVFVDNQEQGVTDSRLSVPEGLHVFDLGAPMNYAPPYQELLVQNTGPNDPMPIAFTLTAHEGRRERKQAKRKTTRKRRTAAKASSERRSTTKKSTKKRSTKKKSAKSSRKKR